MPTSKQRPRTRTAEDALLYAVGEYLASQGWTAMVASVDRIQHARPSAPLFRALTAKLPDNYELVIRFSGGRRSEKP